LRGKSNRQPDIDIPVELHQALRARGVDIAERTVTHLVERYDELLTLQLTDQRRLRERLREQGRVLLALDGLQPDVGHEVVWVVRDCLSGEVLLARSLLSATQEDLGALLREVQQALPVPIRGVLSDGHIRSGGRPAALPGVPHQLCQFHYLREAAKPIYEADRHAKKELKKQVRACGLERQLERDRSVAQRRAYCLAVRSASPMMAGRLLCGRARPLRPPPGDRCVDPAGRAAGPRAVRLHALLARALTAMAALCPTFAPRMRGSIGRPTCSRTRPARMPALRRAYRGLPPRGARARHAGHWRPRSSTSAR
jgi:hypothetical protein